LAFGLKIATFGLVSLDKTLGLLKGPFLSVTNLFFKFVVIPNFGRYLWIKNRIAKNTSNVREKIILTFTNKYVIHLIIAIIALGVTTSNILAYENKEDYGKGALIYNIIGVQNLEIFEDTVVTSEESRIYSYLGESIQVESDVFSEAQKQEEDIFEEQLQSGLATTESGTTLVKPELVSTETAKITRTTIKEYVIEEGDVIGEIAEKFSISVNTILWANNLTTRSYIKPGQTLVIPPTDGVVHTVKKGDTINSIAIKYDTTSSKIRTFNNIGNDDIIPVGETIMVPGGRIVYTVPVRTYTTPTPTTPSYTTPPATTSSSGMIWPSACRRITQYYKGWRHTGLDIACGMGQPIKAVADGVVTRVQYLRWGYGYNVIIDHGGGKQTLYAHASWIYVEVGDKVKQGQEIMREGSTGMSTGPHLHFEVRLNGSKLNPLNYIR
jgi:murein DD-endopeptidase MepM/ murein hydrolase activator NlpD